jgi:zinc transport system substrate-binding protein
MKSKILVIILLITLIFIIVSCQRKWEEYPGDKKLKVATTLFPVYDFARHIAKQKADVSLLLPPGVESHSFELTPGDILKINESDILIYTGRYMEPWVEDILKGINNKKILIIDASKNILTVNGHNHRNRYIKIDPHIWLDFFHAQKMVDNILRGFIEKDPVNSDYYLKNAEEYKKKLYDLDVKYRNSLSSCKKDIFIHGGHFAFGYLARRYNLKYLSAYRGFSPDAEPTPQKLIELVGKIKEHHIKYIFYEELINPKVSEMIAKDTGAKLLKLHGAHNVTKDEFQSGVTFLSLMEQNLRNLKIGLECL